MKYKALLTGNNKTIINEFFTYMDFSFESISTSSRYDDIISHIKYVEPDVFVYCLYEEEYDELKRFANMEEKISARNIPLVVIGSPEDCEEFARIVPVSRALVLQKPISSQKIEASITKFLTEKKQEMEKNLKAAEEKAKAEREAAQNAEKENNQAGGANAAGLKNQEAHKPEPDRRRHILVVDDDSSVLKLLKGYLAERYDVATAISGKVAMKFLETKGTDLVLLDYEMPTENGPEVLGKIRENEKTKHLPVVFLTGVTDRNKITEVLSMKPQGYLLKPVDMEKLSSTIKGILG